MSLCKGLCGFFKDKELTDGIANQRRVSCLVLPAGLEPATCGLAYPPRLSPPHPTTVRREVRSESGPSLDPIAFFERIVLKDRSWAT